MSTNVSGLFCYEIFWIASLSIIILLWIFQKTKFLAVNSSLDLFFFCKLFFKYFYLLLEKSYFFVFWVGSFLNSFILTNVDLWVVVRGAISEVGATLDLHETATEQASTSQCFGIYFLYVFFLYIAESGTSEINAIGGNPFLVFFKEVHSEIFHSDS